MEVIRNLKKGFVRQKHLIWNGWTDRQTDPRIELRYAQLIITLLELKIRPYLDETFF